MKQSRLIQLSLIHFILFVCEAVSLKYPQNVTAWAVGENTSAASLAVEQNGAVILTVNPPVPPPPQNSGDSSPSVFTLKNQIKSEIIKLPRDISWKNELFLLDHESTHKNSSPLYWVGTKGENPKKRVVIIFGPTFSRFNPGADSLLSKETWTKILIQSIATLDEDLTLIVSEGLWTPESIRKRKNDLLTLKQECAVDHQCNILKDYSIQSVAKEHGLRLSQYLDRNHATGRVVEMFGFSAGANIALLVQQAIDQESNNGESLINGGTIALSPILDLEKFTLPEMLRGLKDRSSRLGSNSRSTWGLTNFDAQLDLGPRIFLSLSGYNGLFMDEEEAQDRKCEEIYHGLMTVYKTVTESSSALGDSGYQHAVGLLSSSVAKNGYENATFGSSSIDFDSIHNDRSTRRVFYGSHSIRLQSEEDSSENDCLDCKSDCDEDNESCSSKTYEETVSDNPRLTLGVLADFSRSNNDSNPNIASSVEPNLVALSEIVGLLVKPENSTLKICSANIKTPSIIIMGMDDTINVPANVEEYLIEAKLKNHPSLEILCLENYGHLSYLYEGNLAWLDNLIHWQRQNATRPTDAAQKMNPDKIGSKSQ